MRKVRMFFAHLSYTIGVVAGIYIGGWRMLILPLRQLLYALAHHNFTTSFIAICVLKMVLSLTVGGILFCVGYIGYNSFKGKDDPDWDAINARIEDNKTNEENQN